MKDMTVKELIVKCGVGWNDFKAELLRRFENLKCCGNCDKYERDYEDYCCGATRDDQEPHDYCPHWQSDGLTRAEREGK